ncbi:ankyrin-3 [Aplysia californica]|uniref:Ankyrin-3 n=1 Tax=Aplysia californica TaxID=6500 RepID=A0ABM0JP87_APLCA|nr:ankyrin-3 [Aplysia californica]
MKQHSMKNILGSWGRLPIMLSRHNSQSDQNKGLTDLMSAIVREDTELIKALIESGADLEARDRQGQNALYHAFPDILMPKTLEILQLLLSSGINVNSSLDGDGCSALVTAIVLDWPEVIALLLDYGVDINEDAMAKSTGSLRSDSAFETNLERIAATSQFIFSKGCGHTVTPLLCAVMYQKERIVDMLLKANASCQRPSYGTFWRAAGSSVCSSCDVQVTPLHMAAYLGNLRVAHTLIQAKDNSVQNHEPLHAYSNFLNDITPLWFALLQGHEHIVKLFLSFGKPVVLACHFGSGLQICLEEGHTGSALMLLRAGYDLNDDMEWIEDENYPSSDKEVIERIESLVNDPRPLLDWCASSLRDKFGLALDDYLSEVGAPQKVCDILNFNDLSKASWQRGLQKLRQLSISDS